MSLDLDRYENISTKPALLELKDVDGESFLLTNEKEKVTISLLSVDSKEFKQALVLANRKYLQNKKGSGSKKEESPEEQLFNEELLLVETLVSVTVGWKGFSFKGVPFEYNPENARLLYTKFPFIRIQVSRFVSERQNFLGN